MKPIILSFIALFSLLLEASSQTFKSFSNTKYKVDYPSTWTLDTSKKMGAEFFISSPKVDSTDRFVENVSAVIQDLAGYNMGLDKYAKISEQQIKEMATEGKIHESTIIKTDKTEYLKMVYSWTQGTFKLKFEQYTFIKDEKAYLITLSTELDKFEAYKSTGEQVLNSFMLK